MRNKLLVLILLLLVIVLLLQNNLGKKVFIKNSADIKLISAKDFKKEDNLIEGVSSFRTGDVSAVVKKYSFVEAANAYYCGKANSSKVFSDGGNDIILVQDNSDVYYYKEKNNQCTEIFKRSDFELVFDTNTVYANNSVYTDIESNVDFEETGMSRITKDDIHTFDNLNDKYTNPLVNGNEVIMLQNEQSVVVFNEDNNVVFKQNNDNNARRVIALNALGDSLFMIVKTNNTYVIEGYNLKDKSSIEQMKPLLKYDISSYYKNYNLATGTINIDKDKNFVSFSNGVNTIFISEDFSKVIAYAQSENLLAFVNNRAIMFNDGNYFVLDLNNYKREDIGKLRAFSLKTEGNNVFFGVIDNKQKESYLKFTIK